MKIGKRQRERVYQREREERFRSSRIEKNKATVNRNKFRKKCNSREPRIQALRSNFVQTD